jgi:PAS domain S-box-containing protein
MEKKFLFQPKNIIIIFILMAMLMIASAMFELSQSKSELYELMEKESHALLESLIAATSNSLVSREKLETIYKDRLLNNAHFVKILYEKGEINNSILEKICEENNIYRINIFNRFGKKIYFSHQREHFDLPERMSPVSVLQPIFRNQVDTVIIGIKPARYEKGYRYAVAISTSKNGAIVINVDAESIFQFRKEIGLGSLLKELEKNPQIIYVALQDTINILAATESVKQLESINESEFLKKSLLEKQYFTRVVTFEEDELFEAVHPFYYKEETVGLFRLGLSMEAIGEINSRIIRRLIIISIVLALIGTILFSIIFIRQRYDILQKQFKAVEAYSTDIIKNVSDAIIVLDSNNVIKVFNKTSEKLFGTKYDVVIGSNISSISELNHCFTEIDKNSTLNQVECSVNGKRKYLLISKSEFNDENDDLNTIFVIRDLTNQKLLEEQVKRKERLTAMGELASGVAHEIRNPLNTIGTIAQQLNKDFEPNENSDEYNQLTQLVYTEVKRINGTIQDFLRFARPEPINPSKFDIDEIMIQLESQYNSFMADKNINFNVVKNWTGIVNWDKKQILQVLMNIIQNAIDSIENGGEINLGISRDSQEIIEINISDTGKGMDESEKQNIFNLYFTTKAKGTGIGLSIVQQIIYEHSGTIDVESKKGKGSKFIISIPVN